MEKYRISFIGGVLSGATIALSSTDSSLLFIIVVGVINGIYGAVAYTIGKNKK
jgi:hypothetical protein